MMRSFSQLFCVAILCVHPAIASAQGGSSLVGEIDAVLANLPHAEAVVGAAVVDLGSGKTVYERNADRPLIPASNMKVFVIATALAVLGPSFQFETVLAGDGTNLILIGGGDPALGDPRLATKDGRSQASHFEEWADHLRHRGMDFISGDLLIDESLFDDQRINPTWEASDLGKWYAAPVGALNFNDNCIDITIHPAKELGAPVELSIQPPGAQIEIKNNCKTGSGGTPVLRHPPGTEEYVINGTCGKNWPFGPVAHPNPGMLAAQSLAWALKNKGIQFGGGIRQSRVRAPDGSIPSTLTILDRAETPLADVLQRTGKDSQNLFAECLIKRIGFETARPKGNPLPQGTWKLGAQAILETMASAGIDTDGLRVADGSGLSRENSCTARQLTSVLIWVNRQPFASCFRDSLSSAGTDGSLRRRLRDIPGSVLGKTGTMRGIRTLSGFVASHEGSEYAFAIMFNSYKGPSTPYKEIQDHICRILARGPF